MLGRSERADQLVALEVSPGEGLIKRQLQPRAQAGLQSLLRVMSVIAKDARMACNCILQFKESVCDCEGYGRMKGVRRKM